MLANIKKFIRMDEWLSSKVTMMLAVQIYFFLLASEKNIAKFMINFIAYLLFVFMFLGVSYVVNDLSDLEIDKKAGKKKIIATMPKWLVYLAMFCMLIIGNIPIIVVSSFNKICIICILIIYFFGISYSIPLFRFKEKGLIGLIECSLAQRCMPLIIIAFLEQVNYLYLSIWILMSFFNGLRYILIHQILDMENDIKTGVKTFVSTRKGNYKKAIYILFVLEIICVCLLLIPFIMERNIIIIIGLALYLFLEYCSYMVLKVYAKKEWLVTFDSVPLEALYNICMPILFSIYGAFYDWRFLIIICALFAMTYKSITIKLGLVKLYCESKLKRS